LEVANRILGLLLAALAMQKIIKDGGDLFQRAMLQLQETGIIQS
jgi:small neutral amino acid transporter SnatA (MarC family)